MVPKLKNKIVYLNIFSFKMYVDEISIQAVVLTFI